MRRSIQDSLILVVDDIKFNQAIIGDMLNNAGFTNIATAMSGSEALEKIENLKPDIVLLDLILPDMDGHDICKFIKSNPHTKDISVIVQSSMTQSDQKQKAFEMGANDFINKPIDKIELISRVRSQLEQRLLYINLLDAHENISQDLEEAGDLLNSLLPSKEKLTELGAKYHTTIDSVYKPSSTLGGDYYNAFDIDNDNLGFYLWDFSGHGVTAAINTLRLDSAISDHRKHSSNPGAFLTAVNATLHQISSKGYYATMFYGVMDATNKTLRYAYASCPAPILISKKRDSYKLIDTKEFPLGVVGNYEFKTNEIDLSDWDALVLYSDALIETEDQYGNFKLADDWGKMIVNNLRKGGDLNATNIKNTIMGHFNDNYASRLKDDLTLKVITF